MQLHTVTLHDNFMSSSTPYEPKSRNSRITSAFLGGNPFLFCLHSKHLWSGHYLPNPIVSPRVEFREERNAVLLTDWEPQKLKYSGFWTSLQEGGEEVSGARRANLISATLLSLNGLPCSAGFMLCSYDPLKPCTPANWQKRLPWDAELGVGLSNMSQKRMALTTKKHSLCGDEEEMIQIEKLNGLKALTAFRLR